MTGRIMTMSQTVSIYLLRILKQEKPEQFIWGVIFMKERQDEAYLKFFDWTNVTDDCYVKLIP